jgi:hypothetical protein
MNDEYDYLVAMGLADQVADSERASPFKIHPQGHDQIWKMDFSKHFHHGDHPSEESMKTKVFSDTIASFFNTYKCPSSCKHDCMVRFHVVNCANVKLLW